MSLANKISHGFSSSVRHRGSDYFHMGWVRVKKGGECYVEAQVRGSRNYLVTLSLEENQLAVFCDCPYYESNGPCKHIWATILEADKRGYVKEAARFGSIEVLEALTEDEFSEDGMNDGDDDFVKLQQKSQHPIQARKDRIPGWKEQLGMSSAEVP